MVQRLAASADRGADSTLGRLLVSDGSAAHPHFARLSLPRSAARDLADAVHALCTVYGPHPDLLTTAADRCDDKMACTWLTAAAAGFADERLLLSRLMAAAGPLPSTPGQAETAAALTIERHSLEMLARSERHGVALGAAAALIGDWGAIRQVLARAADRFGLVFATAALPDPDTLLTDAVWPERAVAFGAQQLLAQHRGLWTLLDARASARDR